MSRADYDDPLYRECIPQRITPPPPTTDGPTARWLTEHPDLTPGEVVQLPIGGAA